MDEQVAKTLFLKKLTDLGFFIQRIRKNRYLINNKIGFSIFYSKIYEEKNITWFGISNKLLKEQSENDLYFIIFIIDDPDNVLIIPINIIRYIIKNTNLTTKNYYRIHIIVDRLISQEGKVDLKLYLNNFSQLK